MMMVFVVVVLGDQTRFETATMAVVVVLAIESSSNRLIELRQICQRHSSSG